MAKIKTTQTDVSVSGFINKIDNEVKRDDSHAIIRILKELTGFEAAMWGPSIIGFGKYHYKYDSGHEGDMPLIGFSPRSTAIVFYLYASIPKREELLKRLGKFKTKGGCIYVKKLEDINVAVLKKLFVSTIKHIQKLYPS